MRSWLQRLYGGRLSGEGGSMIMALLAAIIVAGLVTVLVASVIVSQRSVRFDEEFTRAVHVAEAGVEEVLFRLNSGIIVPAEEHDPADPVIVDGDGEIDGETYEWTATQVDDHEWEVVSRRTGDDVNRTLKVTIADQPVFTLAAFSDRLLNFAGTNQADSYNSQEEAWCTGNGRVGSNDRLEFQGSASGSVCADEYERSDQTVDGVDLYDWDDDNPEPERCDHSGGSNCYENNDPDLTWYLDTHSDPIQFDDDVDWMEDLLEQCGDDLEETVRSSDAGFALTPAGAGDGVEIEPDGPYAYCVGELIFDEDAQLTSAASPDDPVVFLVRDRIEVEGHTRVNCETDGGQDCATGGGFNPRDAVYPEAAALRIYTPASDGPGDPGDPVFHARQQSRIGGVMFAPQGTCDGGANVHVFGALTCGDIGNVGGWNFHFDDALIEQIRTGEYAVTRWGEL